MVPSPSGVDVQASTIFDKRCLLRGVTPLEARLSKLPAGTTIYWLDRTIGNSPKTNENERLGYPPEMIIQQVRDDAENNHLEIQLLRGNQKK
jgi:hypothetical protein